MTWEQYKSCCEVSAVIHLEACARYFNMYVPEKLTLQEWAVEYDYWLTLHQKMIEISNHENWMSEETFNNIVSFAGDLWIWTMENIYFARPEDATFFLLTKNVYEKSE